MKETFKAKFQLPSRGFLKPIDLVDTKIGFAVYKEREQKGFKSLFRVYIKDKELDSLNPLKSIVISASYGKETEDGITVSSSEFKRGLNWPVELISEKEFFYDTRSDAFLHKDKEISGIEILLLVDKWHTKTTRLIEGFWLRAKMFWFHSVLAILLRIFFGILAQIQYLISGNKIRIFHRLTEEKDRLNSSRENQVNFLKTSQSNPINIFGYQVQPWIAVLYSLIHLILYYIFFKYSYRPVLVVTLFHNNFLTLLYGILSLGTANAILPRLLRPT
jgi:hypothetical protein